jgi:hypothetical protein
MRNVIALAAFALATGCTAASADQPAGMRTNTEAKLAAELRNYEQVGPPVSCVNERDLAGNHSVGDAIVFNGRPSSRLYVNRPAGGCPDMGIGRALMIRTTGTRLCRGDIATVFDPLSRVAFGGCGLGDFTPYRRIPRRNGA